MKLSEIRFECCIQLPRAALSTASLSATHCTEAADF